MMRAVLLLFYFGVSCRAAVLVKSVIEHENDVKYLVYTKDNSQSVDIHDTIFTKNETIVFIIHGFQTTSLENSLKLKDDIFKYDLNVNKVILLSWLDFSTYPSPQTSFSNYSSPIDKIASHHVPQLAEDITKKMVYIQNQGPNKIELIGHCFGAHAAGQAARLYKQQMGHGIQKIVGLSPTAHFFNQNREHALNKNDSEHVLVLHTNTNRYSMKDEIGTKDLFINGGQNQPQCRIFVLRQDICSHNAAWQEYSNYLKGEVNTRNRSQRYVICLDVSGSMSGSRLTRAIHSATVVINTLKVDSYMGIVTFNHNAQIIHQIVQIKGKDERNALISTLPKRAVGGTCISSGLKTSMEILKNDKFCSTIILISDGEPKCSEPSINILPDLKKNCIKVNSVALGKDASQELEDISRQTDGVVHFVSESGEDTIQQFIETDQALVSSYESGLDPDDRPIHFPSKEVELSNNESLVTFNIDPRIGEDTTFYVNSDGDLDVKLTSPNGSIYSPNSPEYTYDSLSNKHTYNIDVAQPGSWNITASKKQKRKRSVRSTSHAIVGGTTHPLNEHAIKLDGVISSQTLEYPHSVEISAELRSGQFPVIHAQVFAHIKDGRTTVVQLQLYDDGAHPDELADDGVYTVSVIKLPKPGRYSVVVTASSNGTAQLVPEITDYFGREKIDCQRIACQTLEHFERETNIGSIKLISSNKENEIPPTAVTDLRAAVTNKNKKEISLEWSCLVDDFLGTQIKRYDIRVLVSGVDFESAFQLNDKHIVEGSLDATTGSKLQRIIFRIPDTLWKFEPAEQGFILHLKFALKTIGVNNQISKRSNLAAIVIQDQCEIQRKQLFDDKAFLIGEVKKANDKVAPLINANQQILGDLNVTKELLMNETLAFRKELEEGKICTANLSKVTSENLLQKSQLEAIHLKLIHSEETNAEMKAKLTQAKTESHLDAEEMKAKMKADLTEAKTKLTNLETSLVEIKILKNKMNAELDELRRKYESSELNCKQNEGILARSNKNITDLTVKLSHCQVYTSKYVSKLDYEKKKCDISLQLLRDGYAECLANDNKESLQLKICKRQRANILKDYENAKRFLNTCREIKNDNSKHLSNIRYLSLEVKQCKRQNAKQNEHYNSMKRSLDSCHIVRKVCFDKMRAPMRRTVVTN